MPTPITPSTAVVLARHFARILGENLPPEKIALCEEVQASSSNGVCALHDVCDANQYMLEALAATFPDRRDQDGAFDYDPEDDSIGQLMDAAWPLGREMLFEAERRRHLEAIVNQSLAMARSLKESITKAVASEPVSDRFRAILGKHLRGQIELLSSAKAAHLPEDDPLLRSSYPPRADEPIDWAKPLHDSHGYQHSLVHLGSSQVVTKCAGSYAVWDRRNGSCHMSGCEDLTISNTPLTDKERAAFRQQGEEAYRQMRNNCGP